MFELLDSIAARGTALFSGKTFEQPDGPPCALRWFKQEIPAKRATVAQAQDYPFARVRILGGNETQAVGKIVARIVAGIYVSPDTDGDSDVDGADDQPAAARQALKTLVNGLRSLGENGNYAPYSLESIKWWIGDEDGDQPQPDYYYVIVDLEFSQESVLNNL